ncbi:hypothetical protein ACLB1T_21515 [Escherichia coli]
MQPGGAVIKVVDAAIVNFIARTIELVARGGREAGDIKFVAGFGKILIDIPFRLTKCRFQYEVIFEVVFRPRECR